MNSWSVGSNSLANPLAAYLPKSNGIPQIMISKEEEIRHSTARNPTENEKDKNHICLLLNNFKISITVSPKLFAFFLSFLKENVACVITALA